VRKWRPHKQLLRKSGVKGKPPANLESVEPGSRYYPASWRDAAIRVCFDAELQGVLCVGCGGVFRGRAGLTLLQSDHIQPWSRGGLTTWENLQLLCRPCNLRKTDALQ
jgi:5-methylcytosine-specific restriction endonuclease McrA